MRIPKVYGQSKTVSCPFCGRTTLMNNDQGVPVCKEHKNELIEDVRCACGEWMDIRKGKWGPFFLCMNCGPVNFRKGLELNPQKPKRMLTSTVPLPAKPLSPQLETKLKKTFTPSKTPKVITSDDVDIYY